MLSEPIATVNPQRSISSTGVILLCVGDKISVLLLSIHAEGQQIKDNPKTSSSKALTDSMKNFISNNKEKSHPFYWAPFVYYGK